MFLISDAHAQGAAPATGGADGTFLIIMIGVMAVFFVMQMRSQSKRTKETKSMLDSLTKGDEVVTTGGIIGRVSKVGENYLHLETGTGVELQIQRSAVVQVLPKGTLK